MPSVHWRTEINRHAHACVDLTNRELDIVTLLALGASTREIANDLLVSPHTVAAHLAQMLRKVSVANRTELVARLYAEGVLSQGAWPPVVVNGHLCRRRRASDLKGTVDMSFDALSALREANHPVDLLSTAQRTVLAGLTEQEVEVLNSIKDRLEVAAGEVEGQEMKLL
ncbi:LuxR C-terminal-related transcriptional regulator [Micromonospora rifamycinica]|uniref:response regulator transcription factor n=1 Tax=Micromonospora rifamycinica TaxID=291594 RepID=UPI002E2BAA4A|nr:aroma-sacti cluster domain-containing protein [Micromonospora rifamycinica]